MKYDSTHGAKIFVFGFFIFFLILGVIFFGIPLYVIFDAFFSGSSNPEGTSLLDSLVFFVVFVFGSFFIVFMLFNSGVDSLLGIGLYLFLFALVLAMILGIGIGTIFKGIFYIFLISVAIFVIGYFIASRI